MDLAASQVHAPRGRSAADARLCFFGTLGRAIPMTRHSSTAGARHLMAILAVVALVAVPIGVYASAWQLTD